MKGCTSYEIVRRMAQGMSPQQAADSVVFELEDKLMSRFGRAGDLSVVCMNNRANSAPPPTSKPFRLWWRRLASPSPFSHRAPAGENALSRRRR
jgi:isoaspartyl peptidase/L-asparaginase-like protein (Ntn-hydrolase superfamily)